MAQSDRRWEGAGILAGLAIAVLALIVAGIVFLDAENQHGALRDRLDALDARLDAMRTAQRPWVSARLTIASDLTFDATGPHLRFTYALDNSGHSPAFNIVAIPTLVAAAASAPAPDPRRALERRCGRMVPVVARAMRPPGAMRWDYALFPGRELSLDEAAAVPSPAPPDAKLAGPTLVVSCVDYRVGHAADHHQTGDVFYLKRASHERPGAFTDVDLGRKERIPAAELHLSPAIGGTYAD